MIESKRSIPGVVLLLAQVSARRKQAPVGCVAQRSRTLPSRRQFSLHGRLYLARLRPDQHSAASRNKAIIANQESRVLQPITQRAIHSPRKTVRGACHHASEYLHARAGDEMEVHSPRYIARIAKLHQVVLNRLGKMRKPEVIVAVNHCDRTQRTNRVVITCLK